MSNESSLFGGRRAVRRPMVPARRMRAPLRIAVVAPPWYPVPPRGYGGIESMCHALVEGLIARRQDVTLLATADSETSARLVPTFDGPQPGLGTAGEAIVELTTAAVAHRAIERMRVDVVHTHAVSGPLGAPGEMPVVVTVHGAISPALRRLYEHAAPNVVFVAISDAQRATAPELPWLGTVHNGIPVADYPFRAEKDDFALFMGRMNPDKGAHRAIDAARGAGMRVVVAGKCVEPTEHRYFEDEIAPRLGPDVEWVGEAAGERKLDLFARARCLLFPIAWDEPFGLVMVEAMACGTPVVATRRGSVPEVVVDGETGFVVDDVCELADALARLEQISPDACRDHAEQRFDASVMVRAYERSYRRAIELAGRTGASAATG